MGHSNQQPITKYLINCGKLTRSTAGLIILFKLGSRENWINTVDSTLIVMIWIWIYECEMVFWAKWLSDGFQLTHVQQVELNYATKNAIYLTPTTQTHLIHLRDTLLWSKQLKSLVDFMTHCTRKGTCFTLNVSVPKVCHLFNINLHLLLSHRHISMIHATPFVNKIVFPFLLPFHQLFILPSFWS